MNNLDLSKIDQYRDFSSLATMMGGFVAKIGKQLDDMKEDVEITPGVFFHTVVISAVIHLIHNDESFKSTASDLNESLINDPLYELTPAQMMAGGNDNDKDFIKQIKQIKDYQNRSEVLCLIRIGVTDAIIFIDGYTTVYTTLYKKKYPDTIPDSKHIRAGIGGLINTTATDIFNKDMGKLKNLLSGIGGDFDENKFGLNENDKLIISADTQDNVKVITESSLERVLGCPFMNKDKEHSRVYLLIQKYINLKSKE